MWRPQCFEGMFVILAVFLSYCGVVVEINEEAHIQLCARTALLW